LGAAGSSSMIIETFNIRGLGSRVKRRKVREFISSEKT
jgi:hypothetical protein